MSATPESKNAAVEVLKSIDAQLKQLIGMIAPLVPKPTANDADLDKKYGDPEVRTMPRDWSGPSYKGQRFSQCPADLLDMLAEMHDYFAQRAEAEGRTTANGKPVAPYERLDAAKARGWAKRIREGRHTPKQMDARPAEASAEGFDNDPAPWDDGGGVGDPNINW